MGIQDRILRSLKALIENDLENSFLFLATVIDATSKRHFPSLKQKERYIKYLHEHQEDMFFIATQGIHVKLAGFGHPVSKEIVQIAKAVYQVRNASVHDPEELALKVVFIEQGTYGFDSKQRFIINKGMLIAFALLLLTDSVNIGHLTKPELLNFGPIQHGDVLIDLTMCIGGRTAMMATYRSLKNRKGEICQVCNTPKCIRMQLLTNLPSAISRVETAIYNISVGSVRGTGMLVHAFNGILTFVTTWKIVEELANATDKHARKVSVNSSIAKRSIESNAIGVARIEDPETNIGVVWIGRPFVSKEIDMIIGALASIGTKNGLLDLSGGGGITRLEGELRLTTKDFTPITTSSEPTLQSKLVWMAYRPNDDRSECAHLCTVSELNGEDSYLLEESFIPGSEGAPVFDFNGNVVAMISRKSSEIDSRIFAVDLGIVGRFVEALVHEQSVG